ncbi:hypothetical protein V5O48_018080 [Marasmius crinis-equi]|uniref:Uncharacterized protein n=1 Tax=Marasmius crinis-equi TaxID=585013 RepID=A0ABR3EM61_9AGAR
MSSPPSPETLPADDVPDSLTQSSLSVSEPLTSEQSTPSDLTEPLTSERSTTPGLTNRSPTPKTDPSDDSDRQENSGEYIEGSWLKSKEAQNVASGYGRPWRDGWGAGGRRVLKYIRRDLNETGWCYEDEREIPKKEEGTGEKAEDDEEEGDSPQSQRDTSLDDLDNVQWTAAQLFRCLPAARNRAAPAPTFTRSQVTSRIQHSQACLASSKEKQRAADQKKLELQKRKRELKAEIQELSNGIYEASDEYSHAHNKERDERDILEDLRDLELIGLAWARDSAPRTSP